MTSIRGKRWNRFRRAMALLLVVGLAASACSAVESDDGADSAGAADTGSGAPVLDIDDDTTWVQVAAAIAGEDKADCADDAYEDDGVDGLLQSPMLVLGEFDGWPTIKTELLGIGIGGDSWPHKSWRCLSDRDATALYLSAFIQELDVEVAGLADGDRACISLLPQGKSLTRTAALVLKNEHEFAGSDASEFFDELAAMALSRLFWCLPDLAGAALESSIAELYDAELSGAELRCMTDAALAAARGPDIDRDAMFVMLTSDDADVDADALVDFLGLLESGAETCLGVPDGTGSGTEPDGTVDRNEEDDEAGGDVDAEAVQASLGQPVHGYLDDDGDVDVFFFEATGGEFYEIAVSAGTLDDPTMTLYDADGAWLDQSDDYGDSLEPLLIWEAPESGFFYVDVSGYGTGGSYTLSIDVADIIDDHANSQASATFTAVGRSVEGSLDYDGDADYFAFAAVQGELYEITVTSGTLSDPRLTLYDIDEYWLNGNDDYGDSLAPRMFWEASSTDPLFVLVGGYGVGTYTLTITALVTDDDTRPGEGVRVTMGRANWSSGYFQAEVYRLLLEELGYTVSDPAELELAPDTAYVAMAEGQMDFWANSWYPAHLGWVAAELPDGSLIGDHLTILGEQMTAGGLQGFVVSASFADEYGVYTMDDLDSDFRALAAFDAADPMPGNGKADIFGCPEAWSCDDIIENQILFSGWNNISQITADYDAMFAQAADALWDDIPMVAYVWTPSAYSFELFASEGVYWMGVGRILDDSNPSGGEGGETHSQRGADGTGGYAPIGPDQCPSAANNADGLCPIGWIAADILVTANNDFLAANPAAARLLEVVKLPESEVSMANFEQAHGAAPSQLAADWIAWNRGTARVWLSAARAAA
ncbi:glycine betaine ABC transporter substrate-binding protein [Candidatus Poriferisodalis sp.]|uniref:glycine betaine ABC transporter substrate-binding protein n=1 Tax=Candidatus Poriferisodalis sp. TaxID=3101277 RepID=UPI003B01A29F